MKEVSFIDKSATNNKLSDVDVNQLKMGVNSLVSDFAPTKNAGGAFLKIQDILISQKTNMNISVITNMIPEVKFGSITTSGNFINLKKGFYYKIRAEVAIQEGPSFAYYYIVNNAGVQIASSMQGLTLTANLNQAFAQYSAVGYIDLTAPTATDIQIAIKVEPGMSVIVNTGSKVMIEQYTKVPFTSLG